MGNFKIRGKCRGCLRKRWFVRKRKIKLPIGPVATSQDLICTRCYNKLVAQFNQQDHE